MNNKKGRLKIEWVKLPGDEGGDGDGGGGGGGDGDGGGGDGEGGGGDGEGGGGEGEAEAGGLTINRIRRMMEGPGAVATGDGGLTKERIRRITELEEEELLAEVGSGFSALPWWFGGGRTIRRMRRMVEPREEGGGLAAEGAGFSSAVEIKRYKG